MADPRIVVIDDYFPKLETGFRIAEFGWLLEHGVVAEVMTTQDLDEVGEPYRALYPQLADRVTQFDPRRLAEFDLAYLLFVNNAVQFLPALEAAALPFVVTLYPGGGLHLETSEGAARLHRALDSDLVRHVITTQPRVTAAVAEGWPELPLTEVLGVTVNPLFLQPGAGARTDYFGSGKERLDVCFVAYKYQHVGADKGYPQFLDFVRGLRFAGVPLHAHVVGGFEAGDMPDDDLAGDITFYPPMESGVLRRFYLGMDVKVAPNSPHILGPGAFDGFPTGSAVEAALSGVALLCSDQLEQNRLFRNGRDILIEPPEADAMARRLLRLLVEPDGLRRVAQAGLRTARRYYAPEAQLRPRVSALMSAVEEPAADV